ncbi:MAG: putative transport system permease protein [Bacteroidales bacterium]|jgi:putative ABC transport system permease protein|nr:putative transport system permease protein [Bacteroidales bacterium]
MDAKNLIGENFRISLESIRSHALRTALTVAIIAFGIMALVGILTAIDSLKYYLTENFSMMGSNTFNIRNRDMVVHMGGDHSRPKVNKNISYHEAMAFKENFKLPVSTSISTNGTGIATLKYNNQKTNPNIQVIGVDENYIYNAGFEIEFGRNISVHEVATGAHVVVVGSAIVESLFISGENPVGKIITVGPGRYRIVGVMKEKGSSMGFSGDRNCLMPVNNVRQYFSRPNMNYGISVRVDDPEMMDAAIGEATGIFRVIRGDQIGKPDSFSIVKSDNIANMLLSLTGQIRLGATFIGLITLFGAAIGLMNIMLVSVTERTREIGIRKAVGATSKTIRNQFLAEAVIIAQIGGLLGIGAGIGIGNILSVFIGSAFIIPWVWIIMAVILCFIVALLSGIIPANKAAALNPIDSLRYE